MATRQSIKPPAVLKTPSSPKQNPIAVSGEQSVALIKRLPSVEDFITQGDIVTNDRDFWRRFGGMAGLMTRRRNAIAYINICRHFEDDQTVIDDLVRRTLLLTLMVPLGTIENGIRYFIPDFPHLAGLSAAQIYDSIEVMAFVICRENFEKNNDLYERLMTRIDQ